MQVPVTNSQRVPERQIITMDIVPTATDVRMSNIEMNIKDNETNDKLSKSMVKSQITFKNTGGMREWQ